MDSTLVKAKSIEQASKALGYEFTDKHALEWNHPNFPEDLRSKIFSLFDDPRVMCDLATPIEGAQTKIQEWTRQGHTIVLITARNKPVHEATIELVKKHFPDITDVNFVEKDQSKISLMKDKGVQIWCDDAPGGVINSLDAGIDTWMISNAYTRYNWSIRTDPRLKGFVKILFDIPEHFSKCEA